MSEVWRVMRFENAEGKYAEAASNQVGPEQVPVPDGYRFVSSRILVEADESRSVLWAEYTKRLLSNEAFVAGIRAACDYDLPDTFKHIPTGGICGVPEIVEDIVRAALGVADTSTTGEPG